MAFKKKEKETPKQKHSAGYVFGSILRFFFNLLCKYTGLWVVVLYGIIGLIIWPIKENPFKFDFKFASHSAMQLGYMIGFWLAALISAIITFKKLIINPMKNVVKGFKNPVWEKESSNRSVKEQKDLEENKSEEQNEIKKEKDSVLLPPKGEDRLTKRRIKKAKKERKLLARAVRQKVHKPEEIVEEESLEEIETTPIAPPIYTPPPQYTPPAPYSPYSNSPFTANPYTPPKEEPKIYLAKLEPNTLIHEYSDRFEVYRLVNGKAVKDRVEFKNKF